MDEVVGAKLQELQQKKDSVERTRTSQLRHWATAGGPAANSRLSDQVEQKQVHGTESQHRHSSLHHLEQSGRDHLVFRAGRWESCELIK